MSGTQTSGTGPVDPVLEQYHYKDAIMSQVPNIPKWEEEKAQRELEKANEVNKKPYVFEPPDGYTEKMKEVFHLFE